MRNDVSKRRRHIKLKVNWHSIVFRDQCKEYAVEGWICLKIVSKHQCIEIWNILLISNFLLQTRLNIRPIFIMPSVSQHKLPCFFVLPSPPRVAKCNLYLNPLIIAMMPNISMFVSVFYYYYYFYAIFILLLVWHICIFQNIFQFSRNFYFFCFLLFCAMLKVMFKVFDILYYAYASKI